MALDPQNVPISFSKGIDTKSDPKQLMGKLIVLKNASLQSPGQIEKRPGFDELSNSVQGGGTVSKGVGIASFQDEIEILDGKNLYGYSPKSSKFVNRGPLITTSVSSDSIVANNYNQYQADSALNAGLLLFAWYDSRDSGSVRYSIQDKESGTLLVTDTLLSPYASVVKVMSIGTKFVIIYWNSSTHGSLYYKAVDVSTPTVLGSEVTIASDLDSTNYLFDATAIGSNIAIAYGSSSNEVAFKTLSSSLILSSKNVVVNDTPSQAINIFGDASNNAWISYAIDNSGNTSVYVAVANASTGSVVLGKTLVEALALMSGSICQCITGIVSGTTAEIFYEINPSNRPLVAPPFYGSFSTALIHKDSVTLLGVVGSPEVVGRGISLASKAFSSSGVFYFLASFPTVLQATYFLLDQSGNVAAKISPGLGGPYNPFRILPESIDFGSSTVQFTNPVKDLLVSFETNSALQQFYNQTGIQASRVSFSASAPSKINLGNDLIISGGLVSMYDGANVVEQGFNIFPEGVFSISTATGGAIGIGTSTAVINQKQYCAVYEWIDNQGQVHRSAPSIPSTVSLPKVTPISFTGDTTVNQQTVSSVSSTAGLMEGQVISNVDFPAGTYITNVGSGIISLSQPATATHTTGTFTTSDTSQVDVTIPTLRLTTKTDVSIVLYATVNNGSIFYRITSPASIYLNDPTQPSITINDKLADSKIIGNEQLYTTGGEVENIAPPAIKAMTIFKNRAIIIPYQTPLQWLYSKQVIPGVPVEFSDLFAENLDSRGGGIESVGTLDDKIVFFKEKTKFYVVGDGPSPSGANNDFTDGTKIAGTTGCTNQASIVEIPIGLMYQDPSKGIYLLDRSLQEQYIGADVEIYNSETVTSAQLVPDKTQARLTLSNGIALVYDYHLGQWETDIYPSAAVDSVILDEKIYYVQEDGLVQEQSSDFTDNGEFIPLGLKTGWLSFAGITGFQRVWELQILGTYKSPHTLNVNIYTDFSTTPSQTIVIPVLNEPSSYDYRITMKIQKCTALQIEIMESQESSFGEGLSLSSLALRVGMKRGLNKLPAEASF